MEIKIEKKGLIKKGDYQNWYIIIKDDLENTGGYLILYNQASDLFSKQGCDDWVEDITALREYINESGWEIEWLE